MRIAVDLQDLDHRFIEIKGDLATRILRGKPGDLIVLIAQRVHKSPGLITGISFVDIKTDGHVMTLQEAYSQFPRMTADPVLSDGARQDIGAGGIDEGRIVGDNLPGEKHERKDEQTFHDNIFYR
jgi:hypothetical protein